MPKMENRIIYTKIWRDEWFLNLSRASKILFIYSFTNPSVNQTGIYDVPDSVICFETGLTAPELIASKEELFPKVIFYKGWVKVENAMRYSNFKGESNELKQNRELERIPLEIKEYLQGVDTLPTPSLQGVYPSTLNNSLISNTKRYIETFNDITKKNYQVTEKRGEKLKVRLKTFNYEQIETAMKNMLGNPFYRGKNDRNWEATPEWLLENDERVDQFLNKKPKVHSSLNPL